MSCNMSCCNSNLIKATSYFVNGSGFFIVDTFTDSDVDNGKHYKLCLCADLPSMTTIVPVFVSFNGSYIPVQDHLGNNLMCDQLHSQKCFRCVYGSNPAHLKLTECVRASAYYPVEETEASMDAVVVDRSA